MDELIKLKPFLTVNSIDNDGVWIGSTEKYLVKIYGDPETLLSNLDKLKKGVRTTNTVSTNFQTSYDSNKIDDMKHLIKRLHELSLLDTTRSIENMDESRTLSFLSLFSNNPDDAMNKFKNAMIVLSGCGGLGSRIALELGSLGIKNLTLIDPDIVERSNLQRMFWLSEKDCGKLKVNVLKELLPKDIDVTALPITIEEFLESNSTHSNSLIVFTSDGDDGGLHLRLANKLREYGPHITAGYCEGYAMAGPLILPSDEICLACYALSSHQRNLKTEYRRDFIPPSVGFINAIISGQLLLSIVKWIIGIPSELEKQQWLLDIHTGNTTFLPVNTNLRCKTCLKYNHSQNRINV